MEEQLELEVVKKNSNLGIQDYLSLGYIFLLVLGVVHQTIYYKYFGINILDYSSTLDVLISPISLITGNIFLGLAVVFSIASAYLIVKITPKYYNWLSKKTKYQTDKNKIKLEKAKASIKKKNTLVTMIIFYVFAVFVGLGIGRGAKVKKIIVENDYKLTHQLIFEDGDKQSIRMLGKNSLYIFYVIKGVKEVLIVPIDGNIKLIKNLKTKE